MSDKGGSVRLGGLWEKQTRIGTVLSGTFSVEDLRSAAELAVDGKVELAVFAAQERKTEKSPTHSLKASAPFKPENKGNGKVADKRLPF